MRQFDPQMRGAGEEVDGGMQVCRRIVKQIRQDAALAAAADPKAVKLAEAIRQKCRDILRNKHYKEQDSVRLGPAKEAARMNGRQRRQGEAGSDCPFSIFHFPLPEGHAAEQGTGSESARRSPIRCLYPIPGPPPVRWVAAILLAATGICWAANGPSPRDAALTAAAERAAKVADRFEQSWARYAVAQEWERTDPAKAAELADQIESWTAKADLLGVVMFDWVSATPTPRPSGD